MRKLRRTKQQQWLKRRECEHCAGTRYVAVRGPRGGVKGYEPCLACDATGWEKRY